MQMLILWSFESTMSDTSPLKRQSFGLLSSSRVHQSTICLTLVLSRRVLRIAYFHLHICPFLLSRMLVNSSNPLLHCLFLWFCLTTHLFMSSNSTVFQLSCHDICYTILRFCESSSFVHPTAFCSLQFCQCVINSVFLVCQQLFVKLLHVRRKL